MYKKIIDEMKSYPQAYESTGLAFWDDAHISGSMLHNHLAPDADGASRQHDFIRQSAAWIAGIDGADNAAGAETAGKKLLDLGCGPGIYAELLAAKGYAVTGLDVSRRSIAYARESAEKNGLKIEYRCQDYLTLEAEDEYDAVIMIYCDFGVLPPASRSIVLEKVYKALKPGGFFLLDVFTGQQYREFADAEQISFSDSGFWAAEPYVCIKRDRSYDENNFLEQYIIITEAENKTYNLWNHAFSEEELTGDLQAKGFHSVQCFGDAAGADCVPDGRTLCAVGRR